MKIFIGIILFFSIARAQSDVSMAIDMSNVIAQQQLQVQQQLLELQQAQQKTIYVSVPVYICIHDTVYVESIDRDNNILEIDRKIKKLKKKLSTIIK